MSAEKSNNIYYFKHIFIIPKLEFNQNKKNWNKIHKYKFNLKWSISSFDGEWFWVVFHLFFFVQLYIEIKAHCRFGFDCQRSYAYICRGNRCECGDGYRPDSISHICVGGMYFWFTVHNILHKLALKNSFILWEYISSTITVFYFYVFVLATTINYEDIKYI